MANSKQAIKRVRQAQKHRDNKRWQLTRVRSAVKKVIEAAKDKGHAELTTLFNEAKSLLDKVANKGIIHANKAARTKSQLNALVKSKAEPNASDAA